MDYTQIHILTLLNNTILNAIILLAMGLENAKEWMVSGTHSDKKQSQKLTIATQSTTDQTPTTDHYAA